MEIKTKNELPQTSLELAVDAWFEIVLATMLHKKQAEKKGEENDEKVHDK